MVKVDTIIGQLFKADPEGNPLIGLDPYDNQINSPITAGSFISGETSYVFAGPPLLSMAIRYPKYLNALKMVNSVSMSQSKSSIPWTEFGYAHERLIPGKTRSQLSLDKVTSSYDDVKFALYKWMVDVSIDRGNSDMLFFKAPGHNPNDVNNADSLKEYTHFTNLSSEIFNIPFGLLIVQMDQYNKIACSVYAQLCKLGSSSTGISGSPMTTENVGISCTDIVPALNLIVSPKAKRSYTLKAPFDPPIPSTSPNTTPAPNPANAKLG